MSDTPEFGDKIMVRLFDLDGDRWAPAVAVNFADEYGGLVTAVVPERVGGWSVNTWSWHPEAARRPGADEWVPGQWVIR